MFAIRKDSTPGDRVRVKGTESPIGEVVGFNDPVFHIEFTHPAVEGVRDREVKSHAFIHPDHLSLVGGSVEATPPEAQPAARIAKAKNHR